ncbi:RICIN domain-containing protein, partial [Streptacidiphilus monticola]
MKRPSTPPARSRYPGRLRRLLGAGALVVAASLGLGQLPALAATQSPADAGGTSTYDASAAQQQRQDECLLSTVLRLGGPAMKQVAAQGLDGDPAALHAAAAADYWDTTPLSTAYKKDHDAQSAKLDELAGRHTTWEQPLASLVVPNAGFSSVADFRWAPNPGFFDTVGLSPWVAQQFWASESAVYADPTPLAGKTSADAATALGNALYPEPTNGNDPNFEREYNEWRAWQDMTFMHGLFADDTRLLLEGGGFPRTAPDPGTVEFRVAVEDLKSRFASCEWRNPEDPDNVLGPEVQTAATEWQAEVAARQPERDALLAANAKATAALETAAQAFGEALGQSWLADHLARWEAYWQPGGQGSAGAGAIKFQLKSGTTLCLDDPKSSTTNGGPIQASTCTTSNSMQWKPGSGTVLDGALVNVASGKCLYATGGKVQQYTCNNTAAEHWQYTTTGGVTRLYNVGTKQCVNFGSATGGTAATAVSCSTAAAQQFVATQDNAGTGTGTDSLDYRDASKQFTQVKAALTAAQTAAKAQLTTVQQQLTAAQAAASATTTAEQQAYAAADAIGAPRGRGLLAAQQEAQVTMASAAAIQAMVGATQTAYDATTAAATDSQALQAKAQTLGLASKAAFRQAAAQEADNQAKAAAAGAALQAKNAAAAKAKAQQALATAQQAEATAKSAAATAHAKLLAAQAEQQKAEADKQEAAADEATAAKDQATAEQDDQAAQAALAAAQSAGATAADKRQAGEAADSAAGQARQQAINAARTQAAAAAKAQAADAYADAHASQSDAQAARSAADQADAEAAQATTDADNATAAANQATAAAQA